MKFSYEYNTILIDGVEVGPAFIMDVLVAQQKKIDELERRVEDLRGFTTRYASPNSDSPRNAEQVS